MALKSKLSFHNVSFSYGKQQILHQFDLNIAQGEFVSIIGPSGVGKSTIFQLATGLVESQEGTIALDGDEQVNRLGKVGLMPQKDMLMEWRTVAENAALPLELQGISKKVAKELAASHLPTFGLEQYARHYPKELSGGMRQRVSLLRAVLTGADLLLLDEPFSALDGLTRMEMQEWLLDMGRQLGMTIVMITHDLDEAILLADRVLVLQEKPIMRASEIQVTLPRPRTSSSRHSRQFVELKEALWTQLRNSDLRRRGEVYEQKADAR